MLLQRKWRTCSPACKRGRFDWTTALALVELAATAVFHHKHEVVDGLQGMNDESARSGVAGVGYSASTYWGTGCHLEAMVVCDDEGVVDLQQNLALVEHPKIRAAILDSGCAATVSGGLFHIARRRLHICVSYTARYRSHAVGRRSTALSDSKSEGPHVRANETLPWSHI